MPALIWMKLAIMVISNEYVVASPVIMATLNADHGQLLDLPLNKLSLFLQKNSQSPRVFEVRYTHKAKQDTK